MCAKITVKVNGLGDKGTENFGPIFRFLAIVGKIVVEPVDALRLAVSFCHNSLMMLNFST